METSNLNDILNILDKISVERIFFFLVGLGFIAYLTRFLRNGIENLTARFPHKRLLFLQLESTLTFFMYVFGGGILVYTVLQPAKELLFTIGGGVAVAIGLSLKDLVASFVAGLILLFDHPFQVGDRVQFGDVYGEIHSIGLRAVRLITLDDNLVTIPNSRFITDVVASGNAGALDMMIVVPFHLSIDADIKKARDILYEVVVTSRFAYLNKEVSISVTEILQPSFLAIQMSAKAYVLDVQYEKAFQTDVVLRTIEAFRQNGIKRPSAFFSPHPAQA